MAHDYSDLEKNRLEKAESLRSEGIDPYPRRPARTHTSKDAIEAFLQAEDEGIKDSAEAKTVETTLVGRLRSIRQMGKITFAHIEDGSGMVQIFLRANEVGDDLLERFNRLYDLGDFIQASGTMFRTRSGEVTVLVREIAMLAKAVSPLPAAKDEVVDGEVVRHATLAEPEVRYRQRYADLAVNPQVRQIFRTRAATIRALRKFLDGKGFLEVETPILQPIYGGAAARPFTTQHNQLKQDLYLRISFELYLKRLLVGGYERVYEIGRDFRNEGVDRTHNPEFTQLEFYLAYADYRSVMDLTEAMLRFTVEEVTGSTSKVAYQGNEIDFSRPWMRISLQEAILEFSGIDLSKHKSRGDLFEAMRAKELEPNPEASRGKLIEKLLGDLVEPRLIQPTILFDYPRDISPLAKTLPEDTDTVERFEGFAAGMELCNAFTELNDPIEQEKRFIEMGRAAGLTEEDRHPLDEDYLRAMRYGMPPNGGFGMGIDRLTMLLTDSPNIREVLLYPHLRVREGEGMPEADEPQ
ncbi:MAG TPA: lysine--tRNA ligase [Anaerolineales bacterium]|nr:lysine--tRNA ligase [Anaerolineales bacterium]